MKSSEAEYFSKNIAWSKPRLARLDDSGRCKQKNEKARKAWWKGTKNKRKKEEGTLMPPPVATLQTYDVRTSAGYAEKHHDTWLCTKEPRR